MEKETIDYHKLMYHPKRVNDWLEGKTTFPIYMEISLTNACTHKCKFCSIDFSRKHPSSIDTDVMMKTLDNLAKIGVKAVMFGGEGEPLLHKDFISIVKHAKEVGLDVALTTNGVMLNMNRAKEILPYLSWVKFSIDSGEVNTYASIHGTTKGDFKAVLDNISKCKFIVKLKKLDCVIGAQALILKESIDTIPTLAKFLKYVNTDYLVIKPFSEHGKRMGDKLEIPTSAEVDDLEKKVKMHETNTFKVIVRKNAISNMGCKKPYDKCYSQDFIAYIDSYGGVHSCINFMDDQKYTYGNINEESFEEIWKNKPFIEPNLNECRSVCRNDLINRYLWNLKNPVKHVNFI